MKKSEYASVIAMSIGGVGVIGARGHQFLINSQLTEAQALWFYWPVWLLAFVLLTGGYRLAFGRSGDE